MADINIGGLVAIAVFYLLILAIGIWAGRKRTQTQEDTILAGRSLGYFVATFTMTATWVGGEYFHGLAEYVYRPGAGLAWAQYGWAFTGTLLLVPIFIKIMRDKNYTTVLDPFQHKYGPRLGALLILPSHFFMDLMWCATMLASLGATVEVVAGFSKAWSIIISAAISAVYTLFGGLFSVAYTDVIQLACMFVGMWLSVPFMLTNSAVGDIVDNSSRWVGKVDKIQSGMWIDLFLQFMLGAIPLQEYWQRAIACKSYRVTVTATIIAAFASLSFSVPAILTGAAVASTDWSLTSLDANATDFSPTLALPYALQYLTPAAVSFIAVGALTAAVMSSCDSVLLASSTLFARNIYKHLIRPKASEQELKWVLRAVVLLVASLSSALAIFSTSIYEFVIWATELPYIVLFPQFVAVLLLENVVNAYGATLGLIVGLLLRLLAGEPSLSLPAVIKYPMYSEQDGQLFPFRTFSMVCSLVTIIAVSYLVEVLFHRSILPLSWDFLHCFDGKRKMDEIGQAASRDSKGKHEKTLHFEEQPLTEMT